MSSIFVSVGQCGNQLAKTLIDQLLLNQINQNSYLYDNYDGKFHFVNLDSESKVIKNLYASHKQNLRIENLINTKCGRGSNWASGYTGLKKDGSLKIIEKSLESIRKESERCDFLLSFIVMHSLSGGTGSGCGSKLIEQLRDEFGWKKLIMTQSVAPFRAGELPLQHYNNLLCMSHLQEYADFISLHQNDDVLDILNKISLESSRPSNTSVTSKTGLLPFNSTKLIKKSNLNDDTYASVTLNDMNSYIVKSILSAINPVDNISLKSQSFGLELLELQKFLCPNFNLKIVEIYNVNSLNVTKTIYEKNNPLVKRLFSRVPKYKANSNEYYTSLNSLFVARGMQDFNEYKSEYVLGQLLNESDLMQKTLNPVKWNPFSMDFWTSKNSLSDSEKVKMNSLTLVTNRNKCCEYLRDVLEKSMLKYSVKAYVHWYEKFNIDKEFFENSFEKIRFTIDSYDQMTQ
ncbi:unnamed protein product [Brachionus calyciflorus]|uniref:Tubulin delta chain n=1 Tax=Brachionus calyciflorus TaxID=104777 RepID=A0A814P0W5_9BILA|nr:unnamed protein product [Brachionus calyciflorus]